VRDFIASHQEPASAPALSAPARTTTKAVAAKPRALAAAKPAPRKSASKKVARATR
jgi:hypothetical protein